MKYLERLKSEKRAVEVLPKLPKAPKLEKQLLPKLPKAPFDSKDSTDTRHFQKNMLSPCSSAPAPYPPAPTCQKDFCDACGDFNQWRGQCPVDLDDCLLTRILDADGDLDRVRGLDLGKGITTDMVIDLWLESGEPTADLSNQPAWLIVMAEHLSKGGAHGRISEA